MRFVEPTSEWQQAKAVLFQALERLVYHRTELVNILTVGALCLKGITATTGY